MERHVHAAKISGCITCNCAAINGGNIVPVCDYSARKILYTAIINHNSVFVENKSAIIHHVDCNSQIIILDRKAFLGTVYRKSHIYIAVRADKTNVFVLSVGFTIHVPVDFAILILQGLRILFLIPRLNNQQNCCCHQHQARGAYPQQMLYKSILHINTPFLTSFQAYRGMFAGSVLQFRRYNRLYRIHSRNTPKQAWRVHSRSVRWYNPASRYML